MFFLTLGNVKVNFINQKLKSRSYTIVKVLSSTKQVELVRKNNFIASFLDLDDKIFIVYIAFLTSSNLSLEVYLFQ